MRVGFGFDAHAFDESRRLVLGGVEIGGSPGLSGHSDADVLSHAIADALLGAGGLGDLGENFPPDDRWRDASSLDILRSIAAMLQGAGLRVVNVDATVVAQRPRLSVHREGMVAAVSGALGINGRDVSIKVTSTDGLGFAGRGKGIAAFAVVLVDQVNQ
jgi:2-C-methyl-D-erythritol 2,4-cyclodiphosphate synthase